MNFPEITFSGHLAAKPQITPLPDSAQGPTVVARMRVAVTPRRRSRGSDDWVDGETMWFNVSMWRAVAANSVVSLNQGDRVLVRGRLSQRTWKDAEGVERPSFDVEADAVGLDIARYPAMSLRRAPEQRAAEPSGDVVGTADEADRWVSTGQVDGGTGEVLVAQLSAEEAEPEPVDA